MRGCLFVTVLEIDYEECCEDDRRRVRTLLALARTYIATGVGVFLDWEREGEGAEGLWEYVRSNAPAPIRDVDFISVDMRGTPRMNNPLASPSLLAPSLSTADVHGTECRAWWIYRIKRKTNRKRPRRRAIPCGTYGHLQIRPRLDDMLQLVAPTERPGHTGDLYSM